MSSTTTPATATVVSVNAVPVEFPAVVSIPIAPTSRVKFGLVIFFAAVYAVGAVAMAVQFSNPAAASGFGITSLMCAVYTVLLKHAPERIQHCTFLSITKQGLYLFVGLATVYAGLSLYWLATAVQAHQDWNGDSKFCAFIAFLMAWKWTVACALRVRFFRQVAQQHIRRGVVITPGVPIPTTATTIGNGTDSGITVIATDGAAVCPYLNRLQQEQQKLLPS